MEINDIVRIKNPELPFQKSLRYTITKVLKTVVHCYENSNPSYIYKNIPKSKLIKTT